MLTNNEIKKIILVIRSLENMLAGKGAARGSDRVTRAGERFIRAGEGQGF